MDESTLSSALHRAWDNLIHSGPGHPGDPQIRQAAWIARCVGRGDTAPLAGADVLAIADSLQVRPVPAGEVVFAAGQPADGVWIVREGRVELAVGSGRSRAVVSVLRAGDVDGDIPMLLGRQTAYTARALDSAVCLYLARADFERLLGAHPAISRRWLSSVAVRLAGTQMRVMGLLGRTLQVQLARLLLDEAEDDRVHLPQRTLAAMVGAARPSVNKELKRLESSGLVSVGYGVIEFRDRDGLTALAG